MPPNLPLVAELRPPPDVESALLQFAAQPHSLLLDSATRDPRLGRYSFLTADPFDFLVAAADEAGGLERFEPHLAKWQTPGRHHLPPFHGGAAGLLGYELGRSLEPPPRTRFDG